MIDPAGGTIYGRDDQESGTYVHRLHALDLTTGAKRTAVRWRLRRRIRERARAARPLCFSQELQAAAGLLLLNGTCTWSASHCDIGSITAVHGLHMRGRCTVGIYNNTPNGNQGAFWHGGARLSTRTATSTSSPATAPLTTLPAVPISARATSAYGQPGGRRLFRPVQFRNLNQRDLDVGSAGVALLGDEVDRRPSASDGRRGQRGPPLSVDRDNLGRWEHHRHSQIVASSGRAPSAAIRQSFVLQHRVLLRLGRQLESLLRMERRVVERTSLLSPNRFGSPGCLPTISSDGSGNAIVWVWSMRRMSYALDARNANEGTAARTPRASPWTIRQVHGSDGGQRQSLRGTQDSLVVAGCLVRRRVGSDECSQRAARLAPHPAQSFPSGTGLARTGPPGPTRCLQRQGGHQ